MSSYDLGNFISDRPAWKGLVDSIYSSDTTIINMNNESFAVSEGQVTGQQSQMAPQVQTIDEFNSSYRRVVGFDMDDCLAFTTPAFKIALDQGIPFGTTEFWAVVNSSDVNNSVPKQGTVDIMNRHKDAGDDVYIITARTPVNADDFKKWANEQFSIEPDHIIFANRGKVDTMRNMGVSVFYGDSDSDITDARAAGAMGVRVLRSEQSSYKDKEGKLANYKPGTLGEYVMEGTTETGRQDPDVFQGETTSVENIVNLTRFRSGINSVSDAIGYGREQGLLKLDSAIGTGVRTIKEYMAPTMLALESIDKIGVEFDKMIKGTFIDQMFHIKGTEILCTAFCILISFLPCSTRKSLHNAILDIKAAASAITDAARAANDLIQTFNATMASTETIALSAEGLFSGKQNIGQALFGEQQGTGQNIAHATSTIVASISQVKSTIEMISKLLKIVAGAKITIPVGVNGNIWSLANAVLFALQGMAVSFADKALSKIFNPIEEEIRKLQPQNCIGNLAAAFFNKLIDGIRRFKQWLLLLISELFTANNNFGIIWRTFGIQLKSMLELIAFLDALKLILVHFGDLAIACGVELCDDKDSDLRDAIRAGQLIDPTKNNVPAIRVIDTVPNFPTDNIDEIANKLAPILGVPLNNIYVGPNQIQVSQPLITNAPKQIRDLLNDPDIARELGPGYKLYTAPDNSNATVVYSFDRKCGVIKE